MAIKCRLKIFYYDWCLGRVKLATFFFISPTSCCFQSFFSRPWSCSGSMLVKLMVSWVGSWQLTNASRARKRVRINFMRKSSLNNFYQTNKNQFQIWIHAPSLQLLQQSFPLQRKLDQILDIPLRRALPIHDLLFKLLNFPNSLSLLEFLDCLAIERMFFLLRLELDWEDWLVF